MTVNGMRQTTRDDYRERMLRVLVHIQRNLDDELQLEDLASLACFSPFHFHRVFRGMVGEPVGQHVRRLRLERAASRLKHTSHGILDIALEAGYESHAAFTRSFRDTFGASPSDFREASNLAYRLESASRVHFGDESRFEPIRSEDPPMTVEIRSLEPTRIAFLRHVGPYDQVAGTWEQLTDWVGRECLFGADVRFFGMCWDDPEVTPAEKIRYDACVTIGDEVEPEGEIGVSQLEGGRYAVALHEGPYDRLNETYATLLGDWFPGHGHDPGEPPSLEFYLNDPDGTEPEDLLTEVCMPLGPAR